MLLATVPALNVASVRVASLNGALYSTVAREAMLRTISLGDDTMLEHMITANGKDAADPPLPPDKQSVKPIKEPPGRQPDPPPVKDPCPPRPRRIASDRSCAVRRV